MQKPIKVDLTDPSNPDTQQFMNLLDPILWINFVKKVKDTGNKKSIYELMEEMLAGR